MKTVTDAGPLIALGKLGLIQLLSQLFDPILVPTSVYQEVVTRGLELGLPDAYAVKWPWPVMRWLWSTSR